MMKIAALALILALSAGSANAEGCPQLNTHNAVIAWSNDRGDCTTVDSHCLAGDTLTFELVTFSDVNLACSAHSYQWDFSDGNPAATASVVRHRFDEPGVRTISLIVKTAQETVAFTANVNILAAPLRRRVSRPAAPLPPLDERTLQSLILGYGPIDMQPGDTRRLQLMRQQCCVLFVPVIADVRFSIDPVPYATIDADGVLKVAADASGGVTFRVYADIEHGRRIVSNDVFVNTPQSNPLLGGWRQIAEIPCDGSSEIATAYPPLSLEFLGNRFEAVWFGFEIYKDYWGFYTFDRTSKHVTLAVLYGNYVPPSLRGEGTYDVTNEDGGKTLRLKNMWLGRPRGDSRPPGCGMVFRQ
jgi:hypothetical protein